MLDATIIEVRESWPLELYVSTSDGERSIALTEEAIVLQGGESVQPGELVPGQTIRVHLVSAAGSQQAPLAEKIEILS